MLSVAWVLGDNIAAGTQEGAPMVFETKLTEAWLDTRLGTFLEPLETTHG